MPTESTPWARLLLVAMRLGLTPAHFWRLSLKEWRALTAPVDDALTRAAFDLLSRRFPDETHHD